MSAEDFGAAVPPQTAAVPDHQIYARDLQPGQRFREDYFGRETTREVTGKPFVFTHGVVVPVRFHGERWFRHNDQVTLVQEGG